MVRPFTTPIILYTHTHIIALSNINNRVYSNTTHFPYAYVLFSTLAPSSPHTPTHTHTHPHIISNMANSLHSYAHITFTQPLHYTNHPIHTDIIAHSNINNRVYSILQHKPAPTPSIHPILTPPLCPRFSAVFTWTHLLVVVVELDGDEQEALDLIAMVTSTVLEQHYLVVGVVVVVDPQVIPINSRGEKQRMHLRDGFLSDQLDPIYVAYNM